MWATCAVRLSPVIPVPLLIGLLCLFAAWMFLRRDPRMLRIGVLLVVGTVFVLGFLIDQLWRLLEYIPAWGEVLGDSTGVGIAVFLLLLASPVGYLALVGFLLVNGLTMIRREGRSLGNLLSLVAGVGLFIAPLLTLWLVFTLNAWAMGIGFLIFFAVGYLSVVFLVVLIYAWVYGRVANRVTPAAVVVLGAQIIDGQVPPLLASRLDRAVEVYQRTVKDGDPAPLMIPSGGQGPDESRPEGEAMAEYLVTHGIPAEDIRAETQSVSTEENLRFSARVQQESSRSGPMVAVTSNYHALRAGLLARQLKLDAEAVGAKTAAYYVPSAFLREFGAVFLSQWRLHAVLFTPFLLICAGIVFLMWRLG